MTTNNPPITAWAPSTALAKLASRHNNSSCVLTDGPAEFNDVALVRLDDYEALQAELEQWKNGSTIRDEQNEELHQYVLELKTEIEKLRKNVVGLVEALEEGLRAIGDHHAPGDCYATGPMTGDPFRDLVQCPACSFIAMCDDLLAAHREGDES